MQIKMATTIAMTSDSRNFFRWMPSINRPKPGTFATADIAYVCMYFKITYDKILSICKKHYHPMYTIYVFIGLPERLLRPPEEFDRVLRWPNRAFFVSNAWLRVKKQTKLINKYKTKINNILHIHTYIHTYIKTARTAVQNNYENKSRERIAKYDRITW